MTALALTFLLLAPQDLGPQIRTEVARYVSAVNSGDARAVADLYIRKPGVSSAGDGEITEGWQGVLALLGDFLRAMGRVTMTADSIAVTPIGNNAAVAVFVYEWRGAQGRDTTRFRGAMTLVYERTQQGWRVVHDHTSTRPAAAAGRPGAPSLTLDRPIGETTPCEVQRIVDGDTFACADGTRVRLIGIDTPELSQAPFGEQASRALADLMPVGSTVLLERDVELNDQYNRRLAYVWRNSVLVNWQMLRRGWAILLTFPPNVRYVEHLQDAQRRARDGELGLWATGGFECTPADRRRGRCDSEDDGGR